MIILCPIISGSADYKLQSDEGGDAGQAVLRRLMGDYRWGFEDNFNLRS